MLRDIFTDKYLGLRNKGVLSLLSLLLKLVTVIIINQSCLDYSVMVMTVLLWYHEEVIITIYHKEVGYNFLETPHNLLLYKRNLIKTPTWRVESYHFFKKGFTLLVSFQMVFAFWEQRSKMDPPESLATFIGSSTPPVDIPFGMERLLNKKPTLLMHTISHKK